MFKWARILVNWLGGELGDALSSAVAILQLPWRTLEKVTGLIKNAWKNVIKGWRRFARELIGFMDETWKAFANLTIRWIPAKLKALVKGITRTVSRWISKAINGVRGFINDVLDWAHRQFAKVRGFINDVFDWAKRQVGKALTWILKVGSVVADIVLRPRVLVDWILAELWRSWWRLFQMWAGKVGELIFRAGVTIALRSARFLETIIARFI